MNRKEYRANQSKPKEETRIITPEERREGINAFIGDEIEEEESIQDIIRDLLKNRLVQAMIGITVTLIIALVGMIMMLNNRSAPEETVVDYTKIIPGVEYTLTIEERNNRLVGWVESEDLKEEDAVTLSAAIREDSGEDVTLYVFKDKSPLNETIHFHVDGLRYDVRTYPGNRYETRTFHQVPTVEANAEEIRGWDIEASESYVDSDNILHIKTSVPTLATTEETLAFLKGISGVITDMNEEDAFEDIHFNVSSGISTILYAASSPTVIADTQLFQMEQVNRGE